MKDKAIKDAMNIIKNRIGYVYNQGYEDGLKDGKVSVQNDEAEAYESGLNDAWECARKIHIDLSMDKCIEIFEGKSWFNYTASEAIAKIKEYEEKQKRTCDTCQYLHGGFNSLKKCANCYGNSGWTPKKMTLDEAIKHCEEVADSKCDECGAEHRQLAEWLKELKQLKEQEPCEDCIRRSAVLAIAGDSCLDLDSYEDTKEFCDEINDLPPVTPQPKMGRWIEHFDEIGKWYECDQCHSDWGGPVNYCPNCGTRMEGDRR